MIVSHGETLSTQGLTAVVTPEDVSYGASGFTVCVAVVLAGGVNMAAPQVPSTGERRSAWTHTEPGVSSC